MDLRDYFQRQCSEMLTMERETWQLYSIMAQESDQAAVKQYFERNSEPKRRQISYLEQIVDELGGFVGALEYPVTQSFRRLHRQFLEMNPSRALIDINAVLEADKLLSLGTATYADLLMLARQLDEEQMARVLEDNLHAEEAMRKSLDDMLPTLLSELGGQSRKAA